MNPNASHCSSLGSIGSVNESKLTIPKQQHQLRVAFHASVAERAIKLAEEALDDLENAKRQNLPEYKISRLQKVYIDAQEEAIKTTHVAELSRLAHVAACESPSTKPSTTSKDMTPKTIDETKFEKNRDEFQIWVTKIRRRISCETIDGKTINENLESEEMLREIDRENIKLRQLNLGIQQSIENSEKLKVENANLRKILEMETLHQQARRIKQLEKEICVRIYNTKVTNIQLGLIKLVNFIQQKLNYSMKKKLRFWASFSKSHNNRKEALQRVFKLIKNRSIIYAFHTWILSIHIARTSEQLLDTETFMKTQMSEALATHENRIEALKVSHNDSIEGLKIQLQRERGSAKVKIALLHSQHSKLMMGLSWYHWLAVNNDKVIHKKKVLHKISKKQYAVQWLNRITKNVRRRQMYYAFNRFVSFHMFCQMKSKSCAFRSNGAAVLAQYFLAIHHRHGIFRAFATLKANSNDFKNFKTKCWAVGALIRHHLTAHLARAFSEWHLRAIISSEEKKTVDVETKLGNLLDEIGEVRDTETSNHTLMLEKMREAHSHEVELLKVAGNITNEEHKNNMKLHEINRGKMHRLRSYDTNN